jgi:integrase
MKTALTDRAIKAAKPRDRSYDMHDSIVPGLLVEIRPSGIKRIALLKRFPGSKNPTRRLIGRYGAVTLEQGRTTGRRWLELLQAGIDPAVEVEGVRQAEARKRRHTFASVVERYIAIEVIGPNPEQPRHRSHSKLRNGLDVLVTLFGERPVTDFEDESDALIAPLEEIARFGTDHALVKLGRRKKLLRPGRASKPSPQQARALFTFLHMLFDFAVGHGGFGLTRNPIGHIRKARRLGAAVARDHVLTDEELAALWIAAGQLPSSHRRVYRALVLTGLRLNEAACARWSEIEGDRWVIPRERMKGRNGTARPHAVPITDDLHEVLDEIAPDQRGEFIFPGRGGRRPIATGGSQIKETLADEMLHVLRARAKARGEDPSEVILRAWRTHDLRRCVKSGLRKLNVADDVSEAVLAHKRTGLSGIYDVYDRWPERQAALEAWARYLAELINPPPANVLPCDERTDPTARPMPPGRKMRTLLLAKRNHIMPKNTGFRISRQLEERLRSAVKNPPRPTAFMSSPPWRADQKKIRQAPAVLDRSAQSVPPKRRKKGGGRKPYFSQDEIAQLRDVYRRLLTEDANLKTHTVAKARMKRFLPKDKRLVGLRTLTRHVFSPVLDERTK